MAWTIMQEVSLGNWFQFNITSTVDLYTSCCLKLSILLADGQMERSISTDISYLYRILADEIKYDEQLQKEENQ